MIYAFVNNPKGNPKTGRQYNIYKYYKNGGKYTEEMKDIHGMKGYNSSTDSLINNGIVKVMGWIYDYRSFFNKYIVDHKYYGWIECYAPSKMFIRDYFGNHNVIKIAKLD